MHNIERKKDHNFEIIEDEFYKFISSQKEISFSKESIYNDVTRNCMEIEDKDCIRKNISFLLTEMLDRGLIYDDIKQYIINKPI